MYKHIDPKLLNVRYAHIAHTGTQIKAYLPTDQFLN